MKKMFKRYRIDYLLFGGLTSFVLILLTIVILLTYTLSTKELVRVTTYYQKENLNELYNKIEIQMRAIEQISLAATRNIVTTEYPDMTTDSYVNYQKREELETFLSNIAYSTPIIQSIELYTGNAFPSKSQSLVSFIDMNQAKDQSWYEAVENADFAWIGEHTITSNQGRIEVISFARKIYSNSGKYQGFMMLNLKSSSIQNQISGEIPTSNRILLDSGGRVITYIGDPSLPTKIKSYLLDMNNESGYMKVGLPESSDSVSSQKNTLMVWAMHYNSSCMLVQLTPLNQITKGSVHISAVLSLVGVSAILIALLFTLYFSNLFITPIRQLLHEMGRYTANTNKVNLPEDYQNEFGVLFSGYRKLMDRIKSLYVSLENQYKEQKKAEIKALQAMINPHFLYNTLDQLNWMALTAGHDKLSQILELMGKMFRIGLSNGESLITIREEFTHALCYVQIQQLRWEEGLTVSIDLAEHLQDWYIPKMTLQPFIENAIMHGFNERLTGNITISAKEEQGDVIIQITDDGVGLKKNWNAQREGNTGGYGIRNVKERFEAFFGTRYRVDIENNSQASGTRVTVQFPVLKYKQEEMNVSLGASIP
ncbi:sensor histidine kinase [Paenibacillus chondroitinus]|uniref:Sensor histidine kinase n=1 Tax=Paenibacillus chondroitinus TaxID=59842 RepID=A0ABU6DB63_9BACL|nr:MULTISPECIES: sensor histidine kinase [Paenibacillus]MCY9659689.1 sensor histidine kinase [Paenibacillus anseongense]MEB4794132.1 sensor histidine kinase [Paenibacillus chondroitinus]